MNISDWPHQVEIETTPEALDERLQAAEAWLAEWEIPHLIESACARKGPLRICFADERFARAFVTYQGGRLVSADEFD